MSGIVPLRLDGMQGLSLQEAVSPSSLHRWTRDESPLLRECLRPTHLVHVYHRYNSSTRYHELINSAVLSTLHHLPSLWYMSLGWAAPLDRDQRDNPLIDPRKRSSTATLGVSKIPRAKVAINMVDAGRKKNGWTCARGIPRLHVDV